MQQLESGSLEAEENQVPEVAAQNADQKSPNPQVDREKLECLELEKQEVIGEILKLNPSYRTPPDYKPLLKEAVVPIPVKEYPGYNFLGLIFGPASDTQKRLEKETRTVIKVYGTKADTGEKVEISTSDANVQSTYEEFHISISADSYEKVDAATDLIELLVTSVSGSLAAISTSTLVSGENVSALNQSQGDGAQFLVPNTFVNQGVPQPEVGPLQTPLHGQFQSQTPWFPSGPSQNPMHPLNTSSPILSNPVNMPARFPSTFKTPSLVPPSSQLQMQVPPGPYMPQIHSGAPRNFPVPAPQPSSIQSNMPGSHPFTGIQPQPTGPIHIGRPSMPSLPQAVSSVGPRPLPDRPLIPAGNLTGWSGAPANAAESLGSSNLGQLAHAMGPPQGSRPVFASAPPAAGGTSPAFPAALRPTQVPGSAHTPVQPSPHLTMAASPVLSVSRPTMPAGTSGSFSGSITNFSTMNLSSATAPRPPHPSSGDFTFQPHQPQNPSPLTVPRPSGMLPTQSTRSMGQMPAPQSPSFRMGAPNTAPQHIMQVPRPQVGNQMGQPHAHHTSAVPFARNPNAAFANVSPVSPTTPPSQMGLRSFSTGPQMHYPPGPFPPRPANPLPRNHPALPNRPERHMGLNQQFSNNRSGGPQIYDPFSPTSTSVPSQQQGGNPARARKPENDPEYEDLMASVGVK